VPPPFSEAVFSWAAEHSTPVASVITAAIALCAEIMNLNLCMPIPVGVVGSIVASSRQYLRKKFIHSIGTISLGLLGRSMRAPYVRRSPTLPTPKANGAAACRPVPSFFQFSNVSCLPLPACPVCHAIFPGFDNDLGKFPGPVRSQNSWLDARFRLDFTARRRLFSVPESKYCESARDCRDPVRLAAASPRAVNTVGALHALSDP
jgi:hypothetical protein